MPIERKLQWAFLGALLPIVVACATTSTASDVAAARALAAAPAALDAESSVIEPIRPADLDEITRRPLDADAAVKIAILNNGDLRAQLRELGISRGLMVQAGLLPNPRVELEVRKPSEDDEPLQKEVAVEYDLTDAILAPLRADAARADLEAHRYRVAAALVRFGYEVREAVHAAQAAEQRVDSSLRILEALAAARDASRALHAAGNLPDAELAAQEAAYESARASIAELQLALVDARERVTGLLALHGRETAFELAPLPAQPPEAVPAVPLAERRAVERSLDIKELQSRARAAAHRTRLAKTQGYLPDISVDVHAERDQHAWELGGGMSFTVPIFDRKQGLQRAYEAEFDAQVDRIHAAGAQIRSAARRLRARVSSAEQRLAFYRDRIVPARAKVLEQLLEQYNAMQVGIFPLLRAFQDQLEAELSLAEVLREYWTSRAALDALLAGAVVVEGAPGRSPSAAIAGAPAEGGH